MPTRVPSASYVTLWCLGQLAPFIDRGLRSIGLLGYAGAVDTRPISSVLDWSLRLPLILLALWKPSRRTVVMAHLSNIFLFCVWLPMCWDHMCWAAVVEVIFVISARLEADVDRVFMPAARGAMVSLYLVAAFWKLTTSFIDYRTSCASVLFAELASVIAPASLLPAGGVAAGVLLRASPALTALLELSLGPLLAAAPRVGVLLGCAFHLTINVLPLNYAGGFSLMCVCRYGLFLPDGVRAALEEASALAPLGAYAAIAALGAGACQYLHGGIDAHFLFAVLLSSIYTRAIALTVEGPALEAPAAEAAAATPRATLPPPLHWHRVRTLAVVAALAWGLGGPILGWQNMSSLTMYSNLKCVPCCAIWRRSGTEKAPRRRLAPPSRLPRASLACPLLCCAMTSLVSPSRDGGRRHYGGSNHLLVPVDVTLFGPSSLLPGHAALVRVDATDSPTLLALSPADSTQMLPPRALQLLRGAGASGRYFGAYCARMYLGREADLPDGGTIGNDAQLPSASSALSYVMTAYELRRVLALARAAGERFSLSYVRLPLMEGSPARWRAHRGPTVTVAYDPTTGASRCRVGGGLWPAACGANEPGLAPAPPWWLSKVLMQYPVPLVPESDANPGDEIHCSA